MPPFQLGQEPWMGRAHRSRGPPSLRSLEGILQPTVMCDMEPLDRVAAGTGAPG